MYILGIPYPDSMEIMKCPTQICKRTDIKYSMGYSMGYKGLLTDTLSHVSLKSSLESTTGLEHLTLIQKRRCPIYSCTYAAIWMFIVTLNYVLIWDFNYYECIKI